MRAPPAALLGARRGRLAGVGAGTSSEGPSEATGWGRGPTACHRGGHNPWGRLSKVEVPQNVLLLGGT